MQAVQQQFINTKFTPIVSDILALINWEEKLRRLISVRPSSIVQNKLVSHSQIWFAFRIRQYILVLILTSKIRQHKQILGKLYSHPIWTLGPYMDRSTWNQPMTSVQLEMRITKFTSDLFDLNKTFQNFQGEG